jgi:predicted MFS family arabinose efflux permease
MAAGQAISPKIGLPARGLVSTLALATFVNHLNVIAWIPFLPFIAGAHGVSVSMLGQIPALMLLLSAFLGLVIGPLADRYGYGRTLLLCLLAVVASSLSTGLAGTLSVLFLAALFGAIGRAAVMPVAQATAASFFVEDTTRRRAISRIQSGAPLAATLGVPLLTTMAMVVGWRGAFIVLSALAFATALILQRMLDLDGTANSGEVRLRSILAAYRPIFQHRTTLALIVADCVENIGVNAMWTYYGAFYVQRYGFSTAQVRVGLPRCRIRCPRRPDGGWRAAWQASVGSSHRRMHRLRVAHRLVADATAAGNCRHHPYGGGLAHARHGNGQHSRLAG